MLFTEIGDRSGIAIIVHVRYTRKGTALPCPYTLQYNLVLHLNGNRYMAYSYSCLGENECDRGNLEAAEQLSKQALGLAEELGMTHLVAEVNYDLARLERKRDNAELAQQHYNTAHQIFQQLGAVKDLEKIKREWELD